MRVTRTLRTTGTVISFDNRNDAVDKRPVPRWSCGHGLVQAMVGLSWQVLEAPLGAVNERTWVISGKRFSIKPDKKEERRGDELSLAG